MTKTTTTAVMPLWSVEAQLQLQPFITNYSAKTPLALEVLQFPVNRLQQLFRTSLLQVPHLYLPPPMLHRIRLRPRSTNLTPGQ
jgi:hypothetical protein